MVATAIYSVTMVLWKETAFPLRRATEKRWNRNVVSRVSSVIVVTRLPIFRVSSMAISCHVPAVPFLSFTLHSRTRHASAAANVSWPGAAIIGETGSRPPNILVGGRKGKCPPLIAHLVKFLGHILFIKGVLYYQNSISFQLQGGYAPLTP